MASKTVLVLALVSACVLAVGCSDGGGGPPEDHATGKAPSALVAARLEGTFAFDLDASDVAATIHATCEKEAPGDAVKSAACYAGVRKEARDEKVRFTRNAEGQLVYTSFGPGEAGKEEVYLEAPIALIRGATDHALVAKAAGFPRGSFVSRVAFALRDLAIEVPEPGTLVLLDPKKGRLVYRKE